MESLNFLFFTRFSVAITPTPNYLVVRELAQKNNISNKDTVGLRKMYLEYLYSEERMAYKMKAFSNLTIPSVIANLEPFPTAKWMIYTSDECPEIYKNELYRITSSCPQIEIVELNNGLKGETSHWLTKVEELKSYDSRFCTVRCDDDDAIPQGLTLNIANTAIEQKDPFIYHCPNGDYCQISKEGDLVMGYPVPNYPWLLTQGLAGVDLDIRGLGNHRTIKSRFPEITVIENLDLRYLMSCDENFTASKKVFVPK